MEEWADYISFLTKLNKALKGGSDGRKLPQAAHVANRLARCLDPALPSGVHQKALEVYNTIFEIIKGQELHSEIHLWLPGLLPLMSYASINVKPIVITLFEKHILPLPSLRNILRPLLLSFLPGIDDESSETFEQVFKLIEDVKLKVNDDSHFWQCFFHVIITSPERRLGALVWANKCFPSFKTTANWDEPVTDIKSACRALSYEAQMAITPESGLLIRAFCKGLQDDQPLVQRGFLELLVKSLELQSVALQVITSKQDLQLLVLSACSTVLRRDMSLNRRLWNWLLGPEPAYGDGSANSFMRSRYFNQYGLESLASALLDMIDIEDASDTSKIIKACRICLSILDRWEIGSSVVPRVLIPVVKTVKRLESLSSDDDQYAEAVRSASAFFDGVEAINIWGDCLSLILSGDLSTFQFIIDVFNVRDEEMIVNHLPLMMLALLYSVIERSPEWFKAVTSVLNLIPKRAFLPINFAEKLPDYDDKTIIERIRSYFIYTPEQDQPQLPFSPEVLSCLILNRLTSLTYTALNSTSYSMGEYSALLASLLAKIPGQQQWRDENLVKTLCPLSNETPFYALHNICHLFLIISNGMQQSEIDQFVFSLIPLLWKALCDRSGTNHVETVKTLWELQEKLDDRRTETALARCLINSSVDFAQTSRAFTSLWHLSSHRPNCNFVLDRCLFLYLDQLISTSDESLIRLWLDSIVYRDSGELLLKLLMEPIVEYGANDTETFAYYVNTLNSVLHYSPKLKGILSKSKTEHGIKTTFQEVNNICLAYVNSDQCLEQAEGLGAVIRLFSSTLQIKAIELATLMQSLFCLLSHFASANDLASLNQVEVLELMGKLLDIISAHGLQDSDTEFVKNLPNALVQCLMNGISNVSSETVASAWTGLLVKSLNILGTYLLQILIPISECICARISYLFKQVQEQRQNNSVVSAALLDPQIFFSLMVGLEDLMVAAHDKLGRNETKHDPSRNVSDPSFLGIVINGVFSVESPISRSASANDRLTVLLAFQDVIKLSYRIWKWVDTSCNVSESTKNSIVYLSSRFKSQVRKMLVRIFHLEPMETIECLIEIGNMQSHVFKVIHVLDGSRPNSTVPHIFNALISRMNPHNLEEEEKSTLSSDISEFQIARFLVEYLKSLENDAIEEIWYNCMRFIREISNHLGLYRSILPDGLRVIVIMSNKVDSVKFGEQRKIRKELSDLFIKILYYALNTKLPDSTNHSTPQLVATDEKDSWSEKDETRPTNSSPVVQSQSQFMGQEELAEALELCLPHLRLVVLEQDKVISVLSTITVNFIAPHFKSKVYSAPSYITSLLNTVVAQTASQKSWKGTVGDFFLEPKFLTINPAQAHSWKPIISKWAQYDKERVHDFLGRVNSYGSNSTVLFGWSDQESTLHKSNLRRAAFLFLCGTRDGFNISFKDLVDKFELLMTDSSAQVFTCVRAIILSVDSHHLQPIWTFIYTQLDQIFTHFSLDSDFDVVYSACKLLDLLLVVMPEEFQM